MTTSGYEAASQRRQELVTITDRMAEIAKDLQLDAIAAGVGSVAERVSKDAFIVTVLGDFNTGKSTLINALLGSDALPMLPVACTAALTEVRWGDVPSALLYRRLPDDTVDPNPDTADIAKLRELIVVDRNDRGAVNPYAKAEVSWPLELCRNHVILVDSPGLNEDPVREALTMEYLSRTDAVIFLLDGRAVTKQNVAEFMTTHLEEHEPFFVVNFVNHVEGRYLDMVKDDAGRWLRQVRPDHGRDAERTHWVDALSGLRARETGDAQAWRASGIAQLEQDIERLLTTERHKIKILVPARQLRPLHREMKSSIGKQRSMLEDDVEQLTRRYAEAEEPLRRLELDAGRIARDVGIRIADIRDDVERRIEGQLRDLANDVGAIALATVPDAKLSLRPWKTKAQAEAVVEDVVRLATKAVETRFREWSTSQLEPELVRRLDSLGEALSHEIERFEHNLDAIRIDLSGAGAAAGRAAATEDESALSRMLAAAGGLLIAGPGAAFVGQRFGMKEMAKSLLPAIAISLAWLFTPFGWGVLVVALVAQGLFSAGFALKGAERMLKQKVGENLANELRSKAGEEARKAAAALAAKLDEIRRVVDDGLSGRLATVRQEVEAVLDAKRAGEGAAAARQAVLRRCEDALDAAAHQLDDLIDDIAAM